MTTTFRDADIRADISAVKAAFQNLENARAACRAAEKARDHCMYIAYATYFSVLARWKAGVRAKPRRKPRIRAILKKSGATSRKADNASRLASIAMPSEKERSKVRTLRRVIVRKAPSIARHPRPEDIRGFVRQHGGINKSLGLHGKRKPAPRRPNSPRH